MPWTDIKQITPKFDKMPLKLQLKSLLGGSTMEKCPREMLKNLHMKHPGGEWLDDLAANLSGARKQGLPPYQL